MELIGQHVDFDHGQVRVCVGPNQICRVTATIGKHDLHGASIAAMTMDLMRRGTSGKRQTR